MVDENRRALHVRRGLRRGSKTGLRPQLAYGSEALVSGSGELVHRREPQRASRLPLPFLSNLEHPGTGRLFYARDGMARTYKGTVRQARVRGRRDHELARKLLVHGTRTLGTPGRSERRGIRNLCARATRVGQQDLARPVGWTLDGEQAHLVCTLAQGQTLRTPMAAVPGHARRNCGGARMERTVLDGEPLVKTFARFRMADLTLCACPDI